MNTQSDVFMVNDTRAAESNAAGASAPHESAALHVSGEAAYVDDLPELQGTLHCALGLSGKAHARIVSMDLDPVRQAPGVVAVLTAKEIGRASGRERVCQYVSLSGVAGALKKKKKNNSSK